MRYFNYHAKAKNLIRSGHCQAVSFFESYHNIKPAMVLYFDNSQPMPIRDYMWKEYLPILTEAGLKFDPPPVSL